MCHSGANAPQGLRLDAGNSYALLVNVASAEVPGLLRVNPGNPDASYLVQKIQGNAAVGSRMPANGPPFLSQTQIDLVRGWIAAGAPQSAAPPDQLRRHQQRARRRRRSAAGPRQDHRHLQRRPRRSLANANASSCAMHSISPWRSRRACSAGKAERGRNRPRRSCPRPAATSSPVRGDGPAPLADNAGHVLDGDRDGKPGGDTLIPFEVNAGAAR